MISGKKAGNVGLVCFLLGDINIGKQNFINIVLVLNVGCILESPGELSKILRPETHL